MNAENIFINETPPRRELGKHLIDQVVIRFDFPVILGLSNTTGKDGTVTTASTSPLLARVQESLNQILPKYSQSVSNSLFIDLKENSSPTVINNQLGIIHKFTDIDETKVCEITNSFFVFYIKNAKNYTSFEKFLNEFWDTWQIIKTDIKANFLNRIGIRKINTLSIDDDKNLSDFIKNKIRPEFLPSFMKNECNLNNFDAREVFNKGKYWIVSQRGYKKLGVKKSSFFLDFDVFTPEYKDNEIKSILNNMNQIIWELFYNSITTEYFDELSKHI